MLQQYLTILSYYILIFYHPQVTGVEYPEDSGQVYFEIIRESSCTDGNSGNGNGGNGSGNEGKKGLDPFFQLTIPAEYTTSNGDYTFSIHASCSYALYIGQPLPGVPNSATLQEEPSFEVAGSCIPIGKGNPICEGVNLGSIVENICIEPSRVRLLCL